MRYFTNTLLVILLALFAVLRVDAAPTLIKNAAIVDGSEAGATQLQDILIDKQTISAVGVGLNAPEGASIIDAAGKPVTVGLFNADTQIGLMEVGAVAQTVDSSTTNPEITASLQVVDAYNPSSTLIPHNRMLGITHAVIQPGKGAGLFSGSASVVKLTDSEAVLVERAAMRVNLGESGSELAGGSRAAAMAQLREAIEDARDYAKNKDSYNRGQRRSYQLSRHDLEALVPVVERRLPLLVSVERAADILRVLKFAKKQNLTLILSGVSEGWRVADQIASAKVPVIFDPINNLPSSYETLGSRLDNAKLLNDAGVTIMFTGMGWQNSHNAYLVRQSAGNAVANGLPYHVAIRAITSNPAKIFGLPEYGKVRAGAQATLVIWSGDPLEVMSNPDLVMIDGTVYPLESRATRLRDRYLNRLKENR